MVHVHARAAVGPCKCSLNTPILQSLIPAAPSAVVDTTGRSHQLMYTRQTQPAEQFVTELYGGHRLPIIPLECPPPSIWRRLDAYATRFSRMARVNPVTVDRNSRIGFPLVFLVLNTIYWLWLFNAGGRLFNTQPNGAASGADSE